MIDCYNPGHKRHNNTIANWREKKSLDCCYAKLEHCRTKMLSPDFVVLYPMNDSCCAFLYTRRQRRLWMTIDLLICESNFSMTDPEAQVSFQFRIGAQSRCCCKSLCSALLRLRSYRQGNQKKEMNHFEHLCNSPPN